MFFPSDSATIGGGERCGRQWRARGVGLCEQIANNASICYPCTFFALLNCQITPAYRRSVHTGTTQTRTPTGPQMAAVPLGDKLRDPLKRRRRRAWSTTNTWYDDDGLFLFLYCCFLYPACVDFFLPNPNSRPLRRHNFHRTPLLATASLASKHHHVCPHPARQQRKLAKPICTIQQY